MAILKIFFPKVHKGLAIITWATAIRWIGWGLVEGLIAIFLYSFVGTYAQSGILKSVYSIVFLVAVPIVGAIANKVRAKNIILTGLLIYPLIGLSYYLAGLWGAIIFIVVARVLNGISYALDNVGRTTYLRKHSDESRAGSAFGYMLTIANFWWLVAVLASIVLIRYFEIYELFLFIIPTSIISFFMVLKVPRDPKDNTGHTWRKYLSLNTYKEFLHEVVLWKQSLKRLAILSFILGVTSSAVAFFMPIYLFNGGESLELVIIFILIYSLPVLFSGAFGYLADRSEPWHVTLAFISAAVLLFFLGHASFFGLQLLLVFLLSGVAQYISIFIDAEMTRRGDRRRFGSLTSAILEVGEFSSIVGPIAVGFLIDWSGLGSAFTVLAAIIIVFALLFKPVHREILSTGPNH